jgi:hypothetical protein
VWSGTLRCGTAPPPGESPPPLVCCSLLGLIPLPPPAFPPTATTTDNENTQAPRCRGGSRGGCGVITITTTIIIIFITIITIGGGVARRVGGRGGRGRASAELLRGGRAAQLQLPPRPSGVLFTFAIVIVVIVATTMAPSSPRLPPSFSLPLRRGEHDDGGLPLPGGARLIEVYIHTCIPANISMCSGD